MAGTTGAPPQEQQQRGLLGRTSQFFTPERKIAFQGLGLGLSQLANGQTPNLSPAFSALRKRQEAAEMRSVLKNSGIMDRFTPDQRKVIASMPPQAAQNFLMRTMFEGPPKPEDEYGRYVAEELAAGRTPMSRIEFKRASQLRQSISIDADGNISLSEGFGDTDPTAGIPTEQPRLGRKISEGDATLIKEAKEQSANADALAVNVEAARRIVENGFDSGVESGVRALGSRALSVLGGSGEFASQHQDFESVSKAIGMDALRAIGGNDTERELLTAIQTTASPDKEPGANRRIIQRQIAALDVVTQKPGLMEDWVADFGSLSRPNEEGQSWDNFWRAYQLREFREGIEADAVDTEVGDDATSFEVDGASYTIREVK
ncbi:hypothetical protein [Roseovarius sp. MMSF_3359]|nr:hypothetical protein [Roseovarius sp. MMSF_3359]